MKITFTSDLHIDSSPENLKLIDFLVEKLLLLKPDVFIIAGDVASNTQHFEEALKKFSELSSHKLFVPGNHDIWIDSPSSLKKGIHSGVKYNEILPQLCTRNGFIFLGLEPYCIDGIGFAGTIGWYDYSLRNKNYDSEFSIETYQSKQYQDRFTWNDLKFAYWMDDARNRRKSDEEVTQEMETALQHQIETLTARGVARIVVVTHHVPFREMLLYPNRLPWDFFSAFMGSEGLGKIILEEKKVRHVLCGHSHIKSSLYLETLQATKSPVGYSHEWNTKNLRELAEERLACIELNSDSSRAYAEENER